MMASPPSVKNPVVYWSDKTLPVKIYCAPGLLRDLSVIARDGMLAMPRTGMGVGGLLLGRRVEGCIYILKSIEIPCSHAMGPSFTLTSEELVAALQLESTSGRSLDGVVVGWYRSKMGPTVNEPMTMSDHDHALFDALCPEPWQTAMLIEPTRTGSVLAAFGFRESPELMVRESADDFRLGLSGEIAGHELAEDRLEPLIEDVPWQGVADYQFPPPETPQTYGEPPGPLLFGAPALEDPVVRLVPDTKASESDSGTVFGVATPEYRAMSQDQGLWPRRLLVVGALLLVLWAAAFLAKNITRTIQAKRPALELVASPDGPGRISLRWNTPALNSSDSGSLSVATDSDNGPRPLRSIHLDKAQVRSGLYPFRYDGHPGLVTATLTVGDRTASVSLAVAPARFGEPAPVQQGPTTREDAIPFDSHLPDSGTSK